MNHPGFCLRFTVKWNILALFITLVGIRVQVLDGPGKPKTQYQKPDPSSIEFKSF